MPTDKDCVPGGTLYKARQNYNRYKSRPPGFGKNWKQVLIAFGDMDDDGTGPMKAADARSRVKRWRGWKEFADVLECLEGSPAQADSNAPDFDPLLTPPTRRAEVVDAPPARAPQRSAPRKRTSSSAATDPPEARLEIVYGEYSAMYFTISDLEALGGDKKSRMARDGYRLDAEFYVDVEGLEAKGKKPFWAQTFGIYPHSMCSLKDARMTQNAEFIFRFRWTHLGGTRHSEWVKRTIPAYMLHPDPNERRKFAKQDSDYRGSMALDKDRLYWMEKLDRNFFDRCQAAEYYEEMDIPSYKPVPVNVDTIAKYGEDFTLWGYTSTGFEGGNVVALENEPIPLDGWYFDQTGKRYKDMHERNKAVERIFKERIHEKALEAVEKDIAALSRHLPIWTDQEADDYYLSKRIRRYSRIVLNRTTVLKWGNKYAVYGYGDTGDNRGRMVAISKTDLET